MTSRRNQSGLPHAAMRASGQSRPYPEKALSPTLTRGESTRNQGVSKAGAYLILCTYLLLVALVCVAAGEL